MNYRTTLRPLNILFLLIDWTNASQILHPSKQQIFIGYIRPMEMAINLSFIVHCHIPCLYTFYRAQIIIKKKEKNQLKYEKKKRNNKYARYKNCWTLVAVISLPYMDFYVWQVVGKSNTKNKKREKIKHWREINNEHEKRRRNNNNIYLMCKSSHNINVIISFFYHTYLFVLLTDWVECST